ncbi:hypothetical protein F3J02_01460 [Acinetobacter sp. Tr-809]|uniref:hypothetical protein n=1 Tax=Acinetobacter sp. Tr-809 TaxID=2608324 RepID=UPI00141EFBEC|nr:hypothetical protein [Acinetobacter sp. Tr-809]NIE95161.1 hypothetical protein [Acinetobacter sp. Tr-809]
MFKVGFHIVYCDKKKYKPTLFRVRDEYDNIVLDIKSGNELYVFFPHMRLATEQEIAAGHRIDLEELRDCDTSPNCKKYER